MPELNWHKPFEKLLEENSSFQVADISKELLKATDQFERLDLFIPEYRKAFKLFRLYATQLEFKHAQAESRSPEEVQLLKVHLLHDLSSAQVYINNKTTEFTMENGGLQRLAFTAKSFQKHLAYGLDLAVEHLNSYSLYVKSPHQTLNDVVKTALSASVQLSQKKGVQLKIQGQNALENIDSLRISFPDYFSCLKHLADNATKYTQKGNVDVQFLKSPTRLTTSVVDTGLGVPEAEKNNIFDEQFRATNVRTLPGTGYGLYHVQKKLSFVKQPLVFSSVEGVGSRFSFTLPYTANKSNTL
jgi:signal transduction histidine kinase